LFIPDDLKSNAWIYCFFARNGFSICCITRCGQKSSYFLESVRKDFVKAFNARFLAGGCYENVPKNTG
jgi:FPC/CPF motif-containing protein YcgG